MSDEQTHRDPAAKALADPTYITKLADRPDEERTFAERCGKLAENASIAAATVVGLAILLTIVIAILYGCVSLVDALGLIDR